MLATSSLLVTCALLAPPQSPDPGEGHAAGEPEAAAAEARDNDAANDADAAAVADTEAATDRNDVVPAKSPSPRPNLKVLAAGSEPFVIHHDGRVEGIAIEIWGEVADRADFDYEVRYVSTMSEALDLVARGEADALVGPISITAERAQELAFTQPYHQASLSILAPEGSGGPFARIRPFLTKAFLVGLGALLFVLLIVGVLLWFTERKHNEKQFPSHPIRGIGNGIWLALVTMTTVGYGDRAPVSIAGRVIAGAWMLISMITASSLTASIATALTLSQLGQGAIARADQLANHKVGTVTNTPSAAFVRSHRGRLVAAGDLDEAIENLANEKTAAIVYDRPILRHWLSEHPDSDLILSDTRYEPRGYGFALPRKSPLLQQLNVAILELQEEGRIEEVIDTWLAGES